MTPNILIITANNPERNDFIDAWERTDFQGGPESRHQKRVNRIAEIEKEAAGLSQGAQPKKQPFPWNTVALGSDHGGLELKEAAKRELIRLGWSILDQGTHSADSCNYPDFGAAVARLVNSGECAIGLVFCTTGNGIGMTANRFPNVRGVLCHTIAQAQLARSHCNANVMALGAQSTSAKDVSQIREKLMAFLPKLPQDRRDFSAKGLLRWFVRLLDAAIWHPGYTTQDGYRVYAVSNGNSSFCVSELGANVVDLCLGGERMIWHKGFDVYSGRVTRLIDQNTGLLLPGGIPFMFPWTSRIHNSTAAFAGETIDLTDPNLKLVRRTPNAKTGPNVLHGMVDKIRWSFHDAGESVDGARYIALSCCTRDFSEIASRFGKLKVILTFFVKGNRFLVHTTVINEDDRPRIFSFGHHPWYLLRNVRAWMRDPRETILEGA